MLSLPPDQRHWLSRVLAEACLSLTLAPRPAQVYRGKRDGPRIGPASHIRPSKRRQLPQPRTALVQTCRSLAPRWSPLGRWSSDSPTAEGLVSHGPEAAVYRRL